MAVLEAREVAKEYGIGAAVVHVLRGVSVTVDDGEFVSVTGPSGAGKSTLLHLFGALDRPTSGQVVVRGIDTGACDDVALTVLRRRHLGFVFQFFNLLPTLSAAENVAVPAVLDGEKRPRAVARATEILGQVGLADRATHRPDELSGGELQRVAIARALINDPSVVLADEPTGNLDSATGAEIMRLLASCTTDLGRTLVVVTHDPTVAALAPRELILRDGAIAERSELVG